MRGVERRGIHGFCWMGGSVGGWRFCQLLPAKTFYNYRDIFIYFQKKRAGVIDYLRSVDYYNKEIEKTQ